MKTVRKYLSRASFAYGITFALLVSTIELLHVLFHEMIANNPNTHKGDLIYGDLIPRFDLVMPFWRNAVIMVMLPIALVVFLLYVLRHNKGLPYFILAQLFAVILGAVCDRLLIRIPGWEYGYFHLGFFLTPASAMVLWYLVGIGLVAAHRCIKSPGLGRAKHTGVCITTALLIMVYAISPLVLERVTQPIAQLNTLNMYNIGLPAAAVLAAAYFVWKNRLPIFELGGALAVGFLAAYTFLNLYSDSVQRGQLAGLHIDYGIRYAPPIVLAAMGALAWQRGRKGLSAVGWAFALVSALFPPGLTSGRAVDGYNAALLDRVLCLEMAAGHCAFGFYRFLFGNGNHKGREKEWMI